MSVPFRGPVTALFLALPGAFVASALPVAAIAQPAAAEVRLLTVRSDGDLGPGSRLTFRAVASPRAQVAVRVRGVRERIALREIQPGIYLARYTIKRGEVIEADREVRVTVRQGNRTAAADYTLAEVMAAPPVAVTPQPLPPPPPPPLRIERFGVTPVERLEPGAELRFALEGAPGAAVIVDLPGVANDVALRETRPGHYEGAYTLRRSDNLNVSRPIVATLRIGERVVTANLAVPLVQPQADNRPPQVVNISPRDGDALPGGPVQISGNFEDRGGSGVDPASVRILISGRNVTPDAQVTPNSFNLRASLPPGRHAVEVTARDRAGNAVRRDWSFEVSGGVVPVALPLQVTSPGNGASIDGATTVTGRTAPFATVQAKVDASLRIQTGFGVDQQVFSQTLQADGNGNFSFTFSPRLPLAGTRYEVTVAATKAGVTSETRMTLHQR
ncbi:hypothetical protein EEB15_23210 [Ramlibacter sp. WS9]|nr:hypothetical protein EEB15_23210 [Ramlibacter sp. WS9]